MSARTTAPPPDTPLSTSRRAGLWALALAAALGVGASARARDLFQSADQTRGLALDAALKPTWLLARQPDGGPSPDEVAASNLWRLRFSLNGFWGEHFRARVSYEHRTQLSAGASAAGGGLLPSTAPAPYRLEPLDWALVEQDDLTHRHELDRAFFALHFAHLDVTVGRQPVGLGRGVMYSAVDVFAPFSPFEVDREWRRGVDALRVEVPLGDTFSAELIGAADHRLRDGALLGRVRGYLGDVDAALIGGKRLEDWMAAAVASAVLGDAEVHGEAAWYETDGRGIERPWLGRGDWAAKFVLGASYQLDVGRGFRCVGEYHYSGFGAQDVGRDQALLSDPDFLRRLARGDTQILGRHAVALVTSYDLADTVAGSLAASGSPVDGSGFGTLTLTWAHSDALTVVAGGFGSWGPTPRGLDLRSEYGAAGWGGFLQLRAYD